LAAVLELIKYLSSNSLGLPSCFPKDEPALAYEGTQGDAALNQLIQAYIGFDEAGEEVEIEKYDNRHILPVLDTAI
jgi:hypothetical protein